MKLALIQLDPVWESKGKNLGKAEIFVKKAYDSKCDIAVLPEMFSTGFSMNIAEIGEPEGGKTASFLSDLSKKYGINVVAGFAERNPRDSKGQNIAAVFDKEGKIAAKYVKIHPFSHAGEDIYYEAGKEITLFKIDGVPSSVFICYDLRFPEVFRTAAKDVKMMFVLANWPSSRKGHWETLLKARAIENQCFIIGANRTGKDGNGIEYPGLSMVFGPSGEEICRGGPNEEIIFCEIDHRAVDDARLKFDVLKDMKFIA